MIILASGSATRRALLAAAGVAFTVVVPDLDEAVIKQTLRGDGATADATALALADAKAASVAGGDAVVIGADQILVCEDAWFDKPRDVAEARSHLLRLRGKRHVLVTAVTCWCGGARVWWHVARPVMSVRVFSDAFLDWYLAAEGNAVLGSVGAYRLEGPGVQLFDAVEGEQAAVLGLPLLPLLAFLRRSGEPSLR